MKRISPEASGASWHLASPRDFAIQQGSGTSQQDLDFGRFRSMRRNVSKAVSAPAVSTLAKALPSETCAAIRSLNGFFSSEKSLLLSCLHAFIVILTLLFLIL